MPSGELAPANGFMVEIPRDAPITGCEAAKSALATFWEARIARQKEIDASIAAKADFEYLYDKPYEDKKVFALQASLLKACRPNHPSGERAWRID